MKLPFLLFMISTTTVYSGEYGLRNHHNHRELRPVCGDAEKQGSEQCDGIDLAGNDCVSVSSSFTGGTLACDSNCDFDTSGCISGNNPNPTPAPTPGPEPTAPPTPPPQPTPAPTPSSGGCQSDWSTNINSAISWLTSQSVSSTTTGQNPVTRTAVKSYQVAPGSDLDGVFFTYDQAVAVYAYLASGDTVSSEFILNQLSDWQQGNGPQKGSFFTAYSDQSGTVWEGNRHVGPTAWVAMAALKYEQVSGQTTYRQMGKDAIDWCLKWKQADGGINGGDGIAWSSVEHNQDMYAALKGYGGSTYMAHASDVYAFLATDGYMASEDRFLTGRGDDWNAMDVNPWGVLSLGSTFASTLTYVENNHKSTACTGTTGLYDFDGGMYRTINDGQCTWTDSSTPGTPDDVWFEGSAFMAAARNMLGECTEADAILSQITNKQATNGGIPYSCNGSCNQLWNMSPDRSVAATGWFVIAASRVNPFDL